MLKYAVRQPSESSRSPKVLVLLHGYGADEYDLFPVAESLDPRLHILSLQAPLRLPRGGFAWYGLTSTPAGFTSDDKARLESEKQLIEELPAVLNDLTSKNRNLVLLGFSQGAAIIYSLLAKHGPRIGEFKVGAVAALSGYVPEDAKKPLQARSLEQLPVFISHGNHDEVIPVIAAGTAEAILSRTGAIVTKRLYPIGHGIGEQTLRDLAVWLDAIMEPAGNPSKIE